MRKTDEIDTALSEQIFETLTPDEISAMLAEAAAVDALFARMRQGPLHFVSIVSAYLFTPDKDVKSDLAS